LLDERPATQKNLNEVKGVSRKPSAEGFTHNLIRAGESVFGNLNGRVTFC
jgi:hypothetical protein